MGPHNDKDYMTDSENEMDFDFSDTETQPPDDPQSPGGEVDKQKYDQDEVTNINDTVALDDNNDYNDFETQVLDADEDIPVTEIVCQTEVVSDGILDINVWNETQVDADEDIPVADIGNETQLLSNGILDTNLFNETQLVDLAGETQRVEELDCDTHMLTQVLDDNDVAVASDGDDSDRTEVLCDTEEVPDDFFMKRDDMHTANDVEMAPHKEDEASSDGEHQLGSSPCDFTTIRVASTIASGLAAQRMALERANGKSHSSANDRSSIRHLSSGHTCIEDVRNSPNAIKEVSWVTDQEGKNEEMKSLTKERFNICSSTVRKLFAEYTTSETMQSDGGMNESNNEDSPELENGMAGLSYVISQEPGELSQANALEFVDNLLKFNISENDKDVEIRKSNLGNHKVISSVEGTRRLAKIAIPGTPFEKKAIFDWDDNREDEGGGEFFRKKKDLLFDNGVRKLKSLTQPKKPRSLESGEGLPNETCTGERADHFGINKNLKISPKSDSRIGLRKNKGSGNSSKLVESLNKDLNRHMISSPDDKMLDTSTRENDAGLPNVGPDTQIAAEAMETLGIAMPGNDFSVVEKTAKIMRQDCLDVGACNKLHIEQRDQLFLEYTRVVRRQSRRTKDSSVLSRDVISSRFENVKSSSELTRAKSNKARQMVTGKSLSEDDGGNSSNVCSAITEHVKEKRILVRNVDTVANEKRECGLQEDFGSLTPIARRTRQQWKVNQINPVGKDIVHSNKEIKDLVGVAPRKRSKRDVNLSESLLAPVESRDGKSACDEQFDSRSSGTCDLLKNAAIKHPRGRRTPKKVQLSTEKSLTAYNTRLSRLKNGATSAVTGVANVGSTDNDREAKVASDGAETSVRVDSSACTTPTNCKTPVNDASPICIGDEYHKQSCRKHLSRSPLVKELNSLIKSGVKPMIPDSRRRRDMTDVRVLFSHHLDADIIRQQKKVLLRLGTSDVTSMSDATHFITDQFVRTKNMLEAIALGKPVVTHLWLQSCGQANCLIDEKNFILRDARKEKEIGFSMPVSLSIACQRPLLQGLRVLITPNTKPGKEILASLVKAVHGLARERVGRSVLMNETLPDDLLILSCEEDYEICIPFLEKGAAVYSSELLLNGIVTQKLEYDRHRLFSDSVKRTRSNIWVKNKSNQFLPVSQGK